MYSTLLFFDFFSRLFCVGIMQLMNYAKLDMSSCKKLPTFSCLNFTSTINAPFLSGYLTFLVIEVIIFARRAKTTMKIQKCTLFLHSGSICALSASHKQFLCNFKRKRLFINFVLRMLCSLLLFC